MFHSSVIAVSSKRSPIRASGTLSFLHSHHSLFCWTHQPTCRSCMANRSTVQCTQGCPASSCNRNDTGQRPCSLAATFPLFTNCLPVCTVWCGFVLVLVWMFDWRHHFGKIYWLCCRRYCKGRPMSAVGLLVTLHSATWLTDQRAYDINILTYSQEMHFCV